MEITNKFKTFSFEFFKMIEVLSFVFNKNEKTNKNTMKALPINFLSFFSKIKINTKARIVRSKGILLPEANTPNKVIPNINKSKICNKNLFLIFEKNKTE